MSNVKEREYIAALAHDLRAPLAAVNGFANALLDGTAPEEKHQEYLELIARESKRMADMVEGLFQLSVLEGTEVCKERFSLAESARIALLSLSERLERKGICPDIYIEDVFAVGDKNSIDRVIANLMDNAAKFTPHGGRLWLKVFDKEGSAVFELGNSGAPIPEAELARLFDRYYRRDRGGSGAGLGLYLVKTALNRQGADIKVSSDESGTVFSFTLPVGK